MKRLRVCIALLFVFVICLSGCGMEINPASEVETPIVWEGSSAEEDILQYFDEDTVEKICSIPGLSGLFVTNTGFDEGFDYKPSAVLFFTMGSVKDTVDGTSDYVKRVNTGGCIEIYANETTALSRDEYLLGYYLFGITGGKHAYVNNYVVQTSQNLSPVEQDNLLAQLRVILLQAEETVQ